MRAAVGPTLASRALAPASRGSRVARDAAPQPPRGNRKKSGGRRARGRKPREQEFVEDAGRREREFGEAMSRVTARNAPGSVDEEGAGEMNPGAGASFEEKLAAVRREGAAKKAESGTGTSGGAFDMNAKVDFGGAAPSGPMANYMDQESDARESDDEEDGNQTLVRVVSFLAACALVVVFIPSDLTFNAPAGRKSDGLSEKVKEEVQAQADAVVESLNSAPEDVDKLRAGGAIVPRARRLPEGVTVFGTSRRHRSDQRGKCERVGGDVDRRWPTRQSRGRVPRRHRRRSLR